MAAKCEMVRDEMGATSVLTEEQEREIVFEHVFGFGSQRSLAEEFNVGKGTISKVLRHYKKVNTGDLEIAILEEFGAD